MGALLFCCDQPQQSTRSDLSLNIIKPIQRDCQDKSKQTSLQETLVKQMVEQPPSNQLIHEDQEFYDIDSFIEEREKSNLQPKKISLREFQVLGKYGEGSFGIVLQVAFKPEIQRGMKVTYAMKSIPREKMTNQKTIASIKLEREILAKMEHPFITSLKYAFANRHFFYLVMESAEGGDLRSFITMQGRKQAFKQLDDKGVQFVAACTVLGLEYLHSQNILYRDLKTENILVFKNGYAKLSDFGLAKLVNSEEQLSKTHAGTALYNAPEMVLQLGYNKSVDFWALGVLIYQLSTGQTPFRLEDVSTKLRFKRIAQEEEKNKKWRGHHLSQGLKDLVSGLLRFKPENRLGIKSWQQIKSHKFFKDFDWQLLQSQRLQSPLSEILQKYPSNLPQQLPHRPFGSESFLQRSSHQSWDFNLSNP